MSETARPALLPASLALSLNLSLLILIGLSLFAGLFDPTPGLADVFMKEQDLPVAAGLVGLAMVLRFWPWSLIPWKAPEAPPWLAVTLMALAAAVIGIVGWFVVMRAYPLSTDEFMAGFDAAIFREGRHVAVVPAEWRALRFPLQPQYMMQAGEGVWASGYLPLNAAFLALAGAAGSPALVGGFWLALSIVALYGVARRIWPDRRQASLIAVVLLFTSAQFLLAGMTRYAAPAHLALNLVWLWLFLRGGKAGMAGAILVGFIACGLHQVVFHPIFVLPFILELWWARRLRPAIAYTAAYLVIGLFWIAYWRLFFPPLTGVVSDTRDVWLQQLRFAFERFDAHAFSGMAKNLLRGLTWQNPLTLPLALLALAPAIRLGPPFRPMAAGIALLLIVIFALVPDQGHGWGYRYLHPFLGSLCLLATLGWVRMTEAMETPFARAAASGFVLVAAFSILVLLPWRAIQANRQISPYQQAASAIEQARGVDAVVVDATGIFYAVDLVRNDPFLRNRPKVVDLVVMDESDVRTLCAGRRVAVFDRFSGADFKGVEYPKRNLDRLTENRRLMAELGCGDRRVMVSR